MFNPYGGYIPTMPQQQIVRVNGEAGAQTLNLPPNSSALALDETAPIVWLCRTDGAGYKSCTPYAISEYKPAPPVDVNALVDRVSRLEALLNESDYRGPERPTNGSESINSKRPTNVSSISNGGKSRRVHASGDNEEPDTCSDCE